MKTIDLKVQKRETTGKRTAKDLRKAGRVPGVIYHNAEATNISVDIQEIRKVLYSEDTYLVNVDADGEAMQCIVRSADFHPVTDILTHVEFLRVTDDKPVSLSLPIKLTGTAKGVVGGGKMAVKLRRMKVKGIVSKLPERIEVDVTPLELGESIKVMDAQIEGIHVLTAQSAAIATVIIPRALRSAKAASGEEGEAAAE